MSTVDRLLEEWERLGPGSEDPELEAIRMAVLVEDVLGVTLSDEQISGDLLLAPEALRSLLAGPSAHV